MSDIFNRRALQWHRDRCANNLDKYDFLFKRSIQDIIAKLSFHKTHYKDILDLGCRTGHFARFVEGSITFDSLYQADLSKKMLNKASNIRVQCDEEHLPFADNVFDLVISNLNLHWLNDVPGTIKQIKNALMPDGIFIASFIGGDSLKSLRDLLIKIEISLGVKVGLHISPMITADSIATLMERAGFKRIVVEKDVVQVQYLSVESLLRDLRMMGESNCMANKVRMMNKNVVDRFCMVNDFNCVFEIITVSAIKVP